MLEKEDRDRLLKIHFLSGNDEGDIEGELEAEEITKNKSKPS
jgi:hypothetical protein